MTSIKQHTNLIQPSANGLQMQQALNALLTDVTALRTAITAITAKLDADATVTDTNYAATCNPAALTTKA